MDAVYALTVPSVVASDAAADCIHAAKCSFYGAANAVLTKKDRRACTRGGYDYAFMRLPVQQDNSEVADKFWRSFWRDAVLLDVEPG